MTENTDTMTAVSGATRDNLSLAYRSALVDEMIWRAKPESIAYHQAVARVSQWSFVFDQLGWAHPTGWWSPALTAPAPVSGGLS